MDIDNSDVNLLTKETRTLEDLNNISGPNLKVSGGWRNFLPRGFFTVYK